MEQVSPGGEVAPSPAPGDSLVIPGRLLARVREELARAYPREACGVLLGRLEGEERRVTRLEASANRWPGRNDRYRLDPETLRRLLEEEEAGGPKVLGFYHSHPDARPVPSATDRKLAWPWYHYLIVEVSRGRARDGRVWKLKEGTFVERPVRIG
ncbi:MAG: M67 family metallopeptidase [Gemmatimonadota bacterium]